jgi:CheY-like chemotaxis protein/anti-sigma regulatory factor (Ser/Thr protein kinase)
VIRNAVEISGPLISAFEHELSVALPADAVCVNADAARLAQVFTNLLNNAARYTEKGGRIWLTLERQGSDAVVSVKDTGVGIPAEALPRIFDMFTQVERPLEQSQGGLGLGLTIVQRLVELHEGTVEAHSDGAGCGSEFIVRLPVAAATPPEPVPHANDGAPHASANCRVLVVEDNAGALEMMSLLLRMQGHEIYAARDGLQALEAAQHHRPDVVLLDIGLPKLNGFEAARKIREQPWGRSMKLIALSGWAQDEDKRRAAEAGFDDYLVKPIEPAQLEQVIANSCPAPTRVPLPEAVPQ